MRTGIFLATVVAITLAISSLPAHAVKVPDGNWVRLDLDGIVVLTNGKESTAVDLARRVARLRNALNMYRMHEGTRQREVRLFVFKDDESLAPYMPLRNGQPLNLAGYTTSGIDEVTMVIQSRDARSPGQVLMHEFVHAFLAENAPRTPLWLNEGLADFYSNLRVDGDHLYLGEPIHHHIELLEEKRRYLSDARILLMDTDDPEYNEGLRQGMFYAQSWATTHYLLIGKESRRGLMQFLRDIHSGRPEMAALHGNLEDYLPDGTTLREYVTQRSLPHFKLKRKPEDEAGDAVREEMSEAFTLLRLGQLLTSLGPESWGSARAHLERSFELDPSNPEAPISIARIDLEENSAEAAIGTLKEALASSPGEPRVHAAMGYAMVRHYESVKGASAWSRSETVAPELLAARGHLEKGMEDADPQPWVGYAYAMTFLSDQDLSPGIEVLERTGELYPWYKEIFMRLVDMHLRAGEVQAAREVFAEDVLPRTRPVERRPLETWLVQEELNKAAGLAAEGRADDAATLLAEALESTETNSLRNQLSRMATQLETSALFQRYIEILELAEAGQHAEAYAAIEELLPTIDREDLREQAELTRDRLALELED